MSDLLTHIERSLAVDVDLDLEPQCESRWHDAKVDDRAVPQSHGGPATHFQVTTCGHANGLRCAPFVDAISLAGAGYCVSCGVTRTVRFIEL